jgi:hypothetical protein
MSAISTSQLPHNAGEIQLARGPLPKRIQKLVSQRESAMRSLIKMGFAAKAFSDALGDFYCEPTAKSLRSKIGKLWSPPAGHGRLLDFRSVIERAACKLVPAEIDRLGLVLRVAFGEHLTGVEQLRLVELAGGVVLPEGLASVGGGE